MSDAEMLVEIFCSYAPEDESLLRELEVHLSALKRQKLISTWHKGKIVAGHDRAQTIDAQLERASVILLLVSAHYLASDFCYEIEMQRAIERHEAGTARVIPIVIRPCDWASTPFARLQSLPLDGKPIAKRHDRDTAWLDVVAGIRRTIEDISLLSVSAPQSTLPSIWMIPYPRNPFFLGRDDLLSQIHTQLQKGTAMALSQPQAISGLGGVGKTQVVTEYAYRYAQEYQAVLWVLAESIETLNSAYAQLAVKLNLPEKVEEKQEILVDAVKRWLQGHQCWLLILDNADELALLSDFLPPVLGGHLLITTRASSTGRMALRIEVETFTEEQGDLFLLRRAGLLAPFALLSEAQTLDQALAREISRELGELPLALDQAGAYLEQTGYSLSDYQQIYRSHRVSLLSSRGGLVGDHPDPVALTWSLSFERVEQKSAKAVEILRLCAYLSANGIPLALITEGEEAITEDLLTLGEAVETLRAYSLVKHDPATRTLSIHRLVQAVIRDAQASHEQRIWMERVVRRVEVTFPNPWQITEWKACEQWLPHVLVCTYWIEQASMVFSEAADLLYRAGYYLYKRARYTEAELLYQRALSIREQQWGPDHLDVTFPLSGLAFLYREQGRYRDAELLFQRALTIREQQLGPNHFGVASMLNGLAPLYVEQNKYAEAELLFQRALTIREQQLGPDHFDVADSLNNLAMLYKTQGKYGEAEPLLSCAHVAQEPLSPVGVSSLKRSE